MTLFRLIILGFMGVALSGCGLGNVPPAPVLLDLGSPSPVVTSGDASPLPALAIAPVTTLGTLQSQNVIWRVDNDGPPNAYATVQWVSPPAVMVRERLFERLSRQAPVLTQEVNAEMPQVKGSLLQFEQIFGADGTQSEGVVTIQVVLIADNLVVGQYRVTRRVKAPSNTAQGGAQALRTATDEAVNDIAQWVTKTLRPAK
jgi:cholesterol transport system auxiliary component